MSEKTPDQMPEDTAPESSASNLPKAYDPSIIEQRWADYWIQERLFDVPPPAAPGTHEEAWLMALDSACSMGVR